MSFVFCESLERGWFVGGQKAYILSLAAWLEEEGYVCEGTRLDGFSSVSSWGSSSGREKRE